MTADKLFLADVREMWPYVMQFRGRTVGIKIGGAMMKPKFLVPFIRDIVMLQQMGFKIVLVHGGGEQISAKLGTNERIDGLRVTSRGDVKVIVKAMTEVREELVRLINNESVQQNGAKDIAVGISERSGVLSSKRHSNRDLGRVGNIDKVRPRKMLRKLRKGKVVVVTPIGRRWWWKFFNINADTAAASIAVKLGAEKIIWLAEARGIFGDFADPSSFFPTMTVGEVKALRDRLAQTDDGKTLLPRLDAIVYALKKDVHAAHVLSFTIPDSLLLEVLRKRGVGTMVVPDAKTPTDLSSR